jgi:hypothetical protein
LTIIFWRIEFLVILIVYQLFVRCYEDESFSVDEASFSNLTQAAGPEPMAALTPSDLEN